MGLIIPLPTSSVVELNRPELEHVSRQKTMDIITYSHPYPRWTLLIKNHLGQNGNHHCKCTENDIGNENFGLIWFWLPNSRHRLYQCSMLQTQNRPGTVQVYWLSTHYDVIKWKHFPRYWPFVWGIHRSPVNSQHQGQRRGALVFSLICDWINHRVNNQEAGDCRRHCPHYDVIVM